mmetsp:Transcript_126882/g.224906  ORF Transcript_126882/g.224906 Transcript_126882/m.224906 type:complete len:311 (+) Transcript_126882:77-1009(+)
MTYFKALREGHPDSCLVCLKDCKITLVRPKPAHPTSAPEATETVEPSAHEVRTVEPSAHEAPASSSAPNHSRKRKVQDPEDLELELALFQPAREAQLEAAAENASRAKLAEEEEKLKAQRKKAKAEADWIAESKEEFHVCRGKHIARGFLNHEQLLCAIHFAENFEDDENLQADLLNSLEAEISGNVDALDMACHNAIGVNVLQDSSLIECWVRDGTSPSPWRQLESVVVTILSVISMSNAGTQCKLKVEMTLMSGAIFEIIANSDVRAGALAEMVRIEKQFTRPVTLVGPSGVCRLNDSIINLKFDSEA